MTAPLTPEALVEALAEFLANRLAGRRWQAHAHAKAMVAGPLSPLLAALQQVTAERDDYAEHIIDLECKDTRATAEAARLRAEVEAKAAPPGWQLVPREPDSRMKAELAAAVGGNWDIGHDAYVRALAVAPKPALARAATAREGRE